MFLDEEEVLINRDIGDEDENYTYE